MEIQAKILEIFDTVEVSERFRKREFVVEYAENPQFPEFIKFEVIQEKCELLDQFNIGDEVEIGFNLKGRKWTSPQGDVKYFNSLQAWRMLPVKQKTAASPPPDPAPIQENSELPPVDAYNGERGEIEEDDLPF